MAEIDIIRKQISDSVSFAKQFFDVSAKVAIADYSDALFGNRLCPSVTNGDLITFNKAWIEAGRLDSDDIPFFMLHELRHIYQHDQVEKLATGKKLSESEDVVKQWKYGWEHYVRNLGDPESRLKNITQEIEMDANGYAMALLILQHIDIAWSPMIRMENDQYDFAIQRAEKYIQTKPELQKWVKKHQRFDRR